MGTTNLINLTVLEAKLFSPCDISQKLTKVQTGLEPLSKRIDKIRNDSEVYAATLFNSLIHPDPSNDISIVRLLLKHILNHFQDNGTLKLGIERVDLKHNYIDPCVQTLDYVIKNYHTKKEAVSAYKKQAKIVFENLHKEIGEFMENFVRN